MAEPASTVTIPRPDDWHVHLRDGAMMRHVLGATARDFARAVVMPNLTPPVTTAVLALAYRERILAALTEPGFIPLMTCYLTDNTQADDLAAGYRDGIFAAVKLYPAGATTNSDAGVTDVTKVSGVLEMMQQAGVPLLIHGEVVDPEVDVFDREAVFIDTVLDPLRREFPELKIVLEHITTETAVEYVQAAPRNLAATITPHHLVINRNALFTGGLRPHMYCLPVAKRERHRLALRQAATSGDARFFLGTDSAPHPVAAKETDCGCAGIYNAPSALATYAQVFDEEDALGQLGAFASRNGPAFYGLAVNEAQVTLETAEVSLEPRVSFREGELIVFAPPGGLRWRVVSA